MNDLFRSSEIWDNEQRYYCRHQKETYRILAKGNRKECVAKEAMSKVLAGSPCERGCLLEQRLCWWLLEEFSALFSPGISREYRFLNQRPLLFLSATEELP